MKDRNRLILSLTALLSAVILLINCALPTSAAGSGKAFNWYVNRNKDHTQPRLDSSMSFIEGHGGYYVDRRHPDINEADKVVYLTFDVGYENGNVSRILDTLNEKNAKGAFFVLEHVIKATPELVMRMRDEGHTVGNHTCRHRDMSEVSDIETFKSELEALSKMYFDLTGEEMPKYYRPPQGRFSEQNLIFSDELGYKTILWSFAYADWDNEKQPDPDSSLELIMANIHNGAVLLLHPTSKTNADILGRLIDTLRADGYRFGTLDELTGGVSPR